MDAKTLALAALAKNKAPSSGGNADQSGLTSEQISALDGMFKIFAYKVDNAVASDAYKAFQTAFGISGEVEPDEPDVPVTPDEPGDSTQNGWENGVPYDLSNLIAGYYIDGTNGEAIEYATYSMTDYLPCHGASEIRILEGTSGAYNAFYDVNKQYIKQLRFDTNDGYQVPDNAYYIRFSDITAKFATLSVAPFA